jgi:hypothetical protein
LETQPQEARVSHPSQFDVRLIQAKVFNDLFLELCVRSGQEFALDIVRNVVLKDAFRAGRAFAEQTPDAPSLEHFATVVGLWQEGGVLEISRNELCTHSLDVTVVRCGYVQAYRDMELASELLSILSCLRDEAFARGYSPCLRLVRPQTIALGYAQCGFHYEWDELENKRSAC